MTTPRSPFGIISLTLDASTGKITSNAQNLTRIEALKLVHRYAMMLLDDMTRPPEAPDIPTNGADPSIRDHIEEQGVLL